MSVIVRNIRGRGDSSSSINSEHATSMISSLTINSGYTIIPDYLSFNCEIRLRYNPRDQIRQFDLLANSSIDNLPAKYIYGEIGIKHLIEKLNNLKKLNPNPIVSNKDGMLVYVGMVKRSFDLEDIKKICHNFLKYESCIDLLVSPERVNNADCQSNRSLFPASNIAMKNQVYECESLNELQNLMCKNTKNFKLNLTYLVTNGLLQFRQHAATLDPVRLELWLRFIIWFVSNSILSKRSLALQQDRDKNYALDTMFKYVIDESEIEEKYKKLLNLKYISVSS